MEKNILKNSFFIFFIIFLLSYGVLGFNLEGQGINIDELFHHGFGMTYFDLVKEGKILDPCITGKGSCELIDLTCAGQSGEDGIERTMQWVASGGIIKGILLGTGDQFFSNNERVYYASTDMEQCRPIHYNVSVPGVNTPTESELGAARFFSPILGALSVTISFFIGKLLFNRFVGISFASILLLHALWIHHSRILTSEVYVNFFIILSVFLLLYTKNQNNKKIIMYLTFSAITFALAVNTKITSLELFPFLLVIIFIHQPFDQYLNFKKIFQKKAFLKSILLSSLFIGIFFGALFSTFPFYYPDPIGQLMIQYDLATDYKAINPGESKKPSTLLFVASATIAPIIDSYYHIFTPDEIPNSTKWGHTFSSIPLAFFFIIGLVLLFIKIRRRKLLPSEFLLLFWYFSIYTILTGSIESYNTSRHFIPLVFPMIMIASYAIWKFLIPIKTSIKIPFLVLVFFSHAITFFIFWKDIYFNSSIVWSLPVYFEMNQLCALSDECLRQAVNMKESLANPIVLFSGIVMLLVFLIIYIKSKKVTSNKEEQI